MTSKTPETPAPRSVFEHVLGDPAAELREAEAIARIVERAKRLLVKSGRRGDPQQMRRDLEIVHARTPLRLEALAGASDFDLMHDVCGIARHVDRRDGTLANHFEPRFVAQGA